MSSIKKLKEDLYEADEVINELQIQCDIDKKNIYIMKKQCINLETKIGSLNNLLENAENDNYNKNIEIKQIEKINYELKINNKILQHSIEEYEDTINENIEKYIIIENELSIKENIINKLINDNKNFEKIYIDIENYKNKQDNHMSLFDELNYDQDIENYKNEQDQDIKNKQEDETKKCTQIRINVLRLMNFMYILLIIYLLYDKLKIN